MRFSRYLAIFLSLVLTVALVGAAWAQESENAQGEEPQEEVTETQDQDEGQGEEAPSPAQQMLESLPDITEIATQASQEQIGQGQPRLEEQVVYSVSPWNGREYKGTFAPRQVDTIYLMANEYSILNVQRTQVYFWPITNEYMADWFGLREEVPGTLEILRDGQVIDTLERTEYSYYFPSGIGREQRLYLGEEAVRVYEDYRNRLNAYYDAVSAYYEAHREWQRQMDEILREVQETGQYKDPSEIPEPPKQPTPPTDFAYSPRTAFAVNLPEGRYQVRLRGPDGEIVPDTTKTLEVFDSRRQGVGYLVIPEHKWTRSFQTNDPSDILYLDGRRVFYIVPHHAREFNFYQYVKMANLHKPLEGEGTRSVWTWAQFDPITEAKLQVLHNGEVIEEIELKPYYVRQTPGYALGYNIVEFDPENDPLLQGRSPTFEAYRVELEGDKSYELRFVDDAGNVLLGSAREVRPIKSPGNTVYAIPLFPFAIGLVVFGWRRATARVGKGEEA